MSQNRFYSTKHGPSGGWSSWSSFSPCSDACQKYRQRYCTAVDTNECPGADYYGIQTKSVKCSSQECYVHIDGHWSKWSQWSQCSATCDKGIHTRTRVCNDPAPKRGGKACKGSAVDKKVCTRKSCDLGQDDCQFDSDMWCHWTQDKTDTNPWDWQRISGPTQTFGTGPSGDHTSGSGFYIYSEASGPATTGNTASLLSRAFPPSSSRCMTFWYSMNGAGVGNLRVYVKNIGTSNLEMVWDKQGNQGSEWMKGQVDIHSSTEYKVVLEAVRGPTFQGDIGLDDITFTNGRCGASHPSTSLPLTTTSTTSTSPSTTGLPFTITTSSIYQTITLSLTTDMSSLATSTSSPETDTSSPTTDTSSTISTSSPIANKSSPSTSASSTTSTSSPTTDTSSQTASTTSTISSSSPIASKASPSTSAPFPTTIPSSPIPSTSSRTSNTTSPTTASSPKITNSLPPNTVSSESATSSPPKATTSFQPAISTTTSSSGTAASSPRTMTTSSKTTAGNPQTSSQFPTATSSSQTAAVETTEVHNSAVHTTTVATTAAQTTKSTMTITTEPAIIDDFCDFGSLRPTFCTWSNDPTNSVASGGYVFDWWWMKLPTPSRNTGPSRDHTTGKGYYIYLESSTPFETGNKARLLSRQYQSSTVVCLSFWYHMFGETIGSLRVYIDVQEKERQRVWEKSGNQGNTWKMARVSIMNKSSFRIVLEGERGPSYYGDIGLDDVTVKSGECEP
ncbi:MAM and LDL-receptor class A domain-containing protein 2 [Exaiptasia diaphana]|nr:MAM and LDL-receptor class A domain-containing protein 2 [Exaiptasia diaphana]